MNEMLSKMTMPKSLAWNDAGVVAKYEYARVGIRTITSFISIYEYKYAQTIVSRTWIFFKQSEIGSQQEMKISHMALL